MTRKMTITDVLESAIVNSGLTQYRIARGAGVTEACISRFMSGETSMVLSKADKIAAYLGLMLVRDPDAKPPEATPGNLSRPMLTKQARKGK